MLASLQAEKIKKLVEDKIEINTEGSMNFDKGAIKKAKDEKSLGH